jgi:hypothetical protein
LLDAAMLGRDRINLRTCAIGAGLVHAIVLAAVLPILITLPAPRADSVAPRSVAIAVDVIEAEKAHVASIAVPTAPLVERARAPALPVEPILGGGGGATPLLEAEGSIETVEAPAEVQAPETTVNTPEPAPAGEAMTPAPFDSAEITSALPSKPQQVDAPAEIHGQQFGSTAVANLGIESAASAAAAIEQAEQPAGEPLLSAPLPQRKPALEAKPKSAPQAKEKTPAKLKQPAPKKVAPVQAKPAAKPRPRATVKRKSNDLPYEGPVSGMFAPAPKAGNAKLFQGSR